MNFRGSRSDEICIKKEIELSAYWVRLTGNLGMGERGKDSFRFTAFSAEEWTAMIKAHIKLGTDWWRIAGWNKYEILHSPKDITSPEDIKKLQIK